MSIAVTSWVLPGSGSETHTMLPVREVTTWMLTPVVWCLPEYSSGWLRQDQQGRRVPSTRWVVSVGISSMVGTWSARTSAMTGVSFVTERLMLGWDTPNCSAISAWVRLVRK